MAVTIRPTVPADAPELYRAWQAMRDYHASRDHRIVPTPVSPEEFAVAVRATVDRETATAFVAEDGGRIVGFVSGAIEANQPDRLPEHFATVGYIYVAPDGRRQGIARQLIGAMRDWASYSLIGVSIES